MKIIDKYIIKAFIWNYVVSLFVMIGLYIIIDLYLNLDDFLRDRDSFLQLISNIASYYGYNLFLYFSQLAGLITIVAAGTTLAKLQRSNELTAMLSSGLSLYRVAAPLVVMSLLMNGLWILNQEVIIPNVADKLARPRDDAEGLRTYKVWFVPDGKGGLLSALKFSPATGQIRRMLLVKRTPQGNLEEVITAEVADWKADSGVWMLNRGWKYLDHPTTSSEPGLLQTQIKPAQVDVYRSDLDYKELTFRQSSQWTDFLSIRRINEMQKLGTGPLPKLAKVKHSRVTTPIMNVILLFIGIYPFLHCYPRPIINDATISLLLSGVTFASTFIATNLITSESYPEMPPWLPVMIFAPLGAILLDSIET